jgi:DNA-binding response OmpR family regulator
MSFNENTRVKIPSSLSIIVVEDHDSLRMVTVELLRQNGHSVLGFACAEDLDDEAVSRYADIFIIDLNLPNEDGLSLTRRIKKSSPNVGIIMMTARNQLSDRVIGYESGADIYLIKPVNPAELLATIVSLSRRMNGCDNGNSALTLDLNSLVLKGEAGEVNFNQSESLILNALARAKNHQLDYWQIIDAINKLPANVALEKSNLEVKIHRLRQKINKVCNNKNAIKSVRGQGYQLCVDLKIV